MTGWRPIVEIVRSLVVPALVAVVVAFGGVAAETDGPRNALDGTVLLRPTTEGSSDEFQAPEGQRYHVDTPHFRIHFTDTGPDAATIAFVKDTATVLEEVWVAEVERLGWPEPLPDEGLGGTGRHGQDLVDVYLVDLDDGPYGYVAADEENPCVLCRSVHGFLVLENDYIGYEPNPPDALRSTAAHEFAHLIHMRMAWDGEPWAYEATAVWMEQAVYPDADARTAYLQDFAARPELSLSDFSLGGGGFDRAYGAYVWNLWLAERYGDDVIRQVWQAASDADSHLLGGYATVLAERGTSLDEEMVAFVAATAAWEVAGFPGEPLPYPTVSRAGTLASGEVAEVVVDHAAAHVVDLEGVGAVVTVTVRGPRHVAGGVAVVATGEGRVVQAIDGTLFDGQATVTLAGLGDAGRVSLVVVNADAALARPKRDGDDRASYLNDEVVWVVGVDVDPGAPQKR